MMRPRLRWRLSAALIAPLALSVCARSRAREANMDGVARVSVTNFTGSTVGAIYLSPHDAPTWQENVLAGDHLPDGASVDIRVPLHGAPAQWDLRIEDGRAQYHAEWKNLDLRRIASVTLRLDGRYVLAVLEPAGPDRLDTARSLSVR